MTLDPILSAPFAIQVHALGATLAVLLGPIAMYRNRRDRLHKSVGYIWVVTMIFVAVSAFFIEADVLPLIGPFGPIHVFAIWALTSIWQAMGAIYRRDIIRHQKIMRALYWQALGIAGLLTLLPGRRMNAMLFGETPQIGVWVIAGIAVLAAAIVVGRRLRGRARGRGPVAG